MIEFIFAGTIVTLLGTGKIAFSIAEKKEEKERLENKKLEVYGKELDKSHANDIAEIAMIKINQEIKKIERRKECIDEKWKIMINEKIRKSKPIIQKYNELPFEKRMQVEDEVREMLIHILGEIEKEKKESNKELKEKFAKKIKEVTGTN